jgi:hypothetical protein
MISRWARIIAFAAFPLAAQTRTTTLRGYVRDSLGGPIRDVVVTVLTKGNMTHSDSTGRFQLSGLPGGDTRVEYRRLGFAPETTRMALRAGGVDTVAVVLRALPAELAGVEVTDPNAEFRNGMSGFNRRRTAGYGHFITREEIEKYNTHQMADLLRRIPGVQFVRLPDGTMDVRLSRTNSGQGHDCPPEWLIDGIRAPGLRVDDFAPDDLEGVEVYSGASTIPPEFNVSGGTVGCGVIVLWTKRPGDNR